MKGNYPKDDEGYFQARSQRLRELWVICQQQLALVLAETIANADRRRSYLDDFEQHEDKYLEL